MEISLGWLYWIGFDLYNRADSRRKKLAFLYLEYWFYLPLMMISNLTFIPLNAQKLVLQMLILPIYYGYYFEK